MSKTGNLTAAEATQAIAELIEHVKLLRREVEDLKREVRPR